MTERLVQAVGVLLRGPLKGTRKRLTRDSALLYLPSATHLRGKNDGSTPVLMLPADARAKVAPTPTVARPLLVVLYGQRDVVLQVMAVTTWARALPVGPDIALPVNGRDAQLLWAAPHTAIRESTTLSVDDDEGGGSDNPMDAPEPVDWLESLAGHRAAPPTPAHASATRDTVERCFMDYVALLADGALALQLLRTSRYHGLTRLRALFVASGRWAPARLTVLRSAHARRMATALFATAVVATSYPTAARLEWLDVERLLAVLLPPLQTPARTIISLDEWMRASSETVAQNLTSYMRGGADGGSTDKERAPQRDTIPVDGSMQQWSVSAEFVVDHLRPHRHWQRCRALLAGVTPDERAHLADGGDMISPLILRLLRHPLQHVTAGRPLVHLERIADALAGRVVHPAAPTLAARYMAGDPYAARRLEGRGARVDATAVARGVAGDIEELGTLLPPCMARVRQHARTVTHHLADDDRVHAAGFYAALGFGPDDVPALVRFTEGAAASSPFAGVLMQRLRGVAAGKPAYSHGCGKIRAETVAGKIKGASQVSCEFASPAACGAACGMGNQTFRSPADFVALRLRAQRPAPAPAPMQ